MMSPNQLSSDLRLNLTQKLSSYHLSIISLLGLMFPPQPLWSHLIIF